MYIYTYTDIGLPEYGNEKFKTIYGITWFDPIVIIMSIDIIRY